MEDLILRADNVSYAYEDSEGMAVRGVTLGFRAGGMDVPDCLTNEELCDAICRALGKEADAHA